MHLVFYTNLICIFLVIEMHEVPSIDKNVIICFSFTNSPSSRMWIILLQTAFKNQFFNLREGKKQNFSRHLIFKFLFIMCELFLTQLCQMNIFSVIVLYYYNWLYPLLQMNVESLCTYIFSLFFSFVTYSFFIMFIYFVQFLYK